MPNVLSTVPIGELAERLAAAIPHPAAAARFAKMARDQLFNDERNYRPLTARELKRAPDWAKQAVEDGATVDKFVANRSAVARLRRVAKRLGAICADIDRHTHTNPAPAVMPVLREFIVKLDRASFETVERKVLMFEFEREEREAQEIVDKPLYPAVEIYASPGRTWRRILSLGELWRVGREFHNCLARASRHNPGYAQRMTHNAAQFWVLRDRAGVGLMVAMASVLDQRICEVRGPRNAIIAHDDPDLRQLALARGLLRPHDPLEPPPAPRPPRPPLSLALNPFDAPILSALMLPRGLRRN